MLTIETVIDFLRRLAPLRLAEDWDNVGLLVGDPRRKARRLMTCLSITAEVAQEAVRDRADLIVSHHPLPFDALRQITTATPTGRLLLELIEAKTAVYSPHTAFDSAADGINQRLARGLGLRGVFPLVFAREGLGAGRTGWLEEPLSLGQVVERVKQFLGLQRLQVVGDPQRAIRTVAVACGAGGEFLTAARDAHCEALLLGETRYHTCLEADALGIALILPGHFASERFALECLAEEIAEEFPDLHVWASSHDRDPLRWV